MNYLSKVTTGKIKKPYNVLLYGVDGIGKSTWAANAPSPIFLGPEDGTNNLDVARFNDINSWDNATACLAELFQQDHKYKTLVIDTIDWLEIFAWRKIIGMTGKNINTVNGGYGAGREDSKAMFIDFIKGCKMLREHKKMNIIFLAHSDIENFTKQNLNETYQRYSLKLDKKVNSIFREYSEDVLFATFKAYAKKEDSGPVKTFGDGVRVVYTERRPAFDAKNRNGLPFEMSLDWNDYALAVKTGEPESPKAINQRIEGMLSTVKNDDLKTKVSAAVLKAGNNAAQLGIIANRLQVRLGEA